LLLKTAHVLAPLQLTEHRTLAVVIATITLVGALACASSNFPACRCHWPVSARRIVPTVKATGA
jgi:hypothetical protein